MTERAEVVRYESPQVGGFRPSTLTEAMTLAAKLSESQLLPVPLRGKPADVLIVLMKGQELGLSPMQSISSIHVIAGKAVASADLMVGLVKSRPDCLYFRLVESTPSVATYETMRRGDPEPTSMSYTIQDAQKAKLTAKDTWTNHPAAMLRARCSSALARAVYPDHVMGIYTTDEAQEFAQVDIEPPRTVARPRSIAPPAAETPAPKASPAPDSPDLELQPEDGRPSYTGSVESVTFKTGNTKGRDWTLYTIKMADGEAFGTFDTKIAEFATEAVKSNTPVRIVWEQTSKGNKNAVEIVSAF